ncbi:MAG: hypothetical protein KDA92_12800 [Planctomycetales bacterium]|nr:hypothetical protein [Planctomycetales bacterium]
MQWHGDEAARHSELDRVSIAAAAALNSPPTRCTRLLTRDDEASVFSRLRRRILRSVLRQLWQESSLRAALITFLTISFWLIMFVLFHEGFGLLRTAVTHPPTLARAVHAVYNVFFLSLLLMLSVSAGILYYAAIYKSPEVNLLLTLPVHASRIAAEKFIEATVLACWGFVLLGSPLLVAYGMVNQTPWGYFALLLPLLISFAVIPSAIGALACLSLVAIAPRYRSAAVGVLGICLLGVFLYLVWIVFGHGQQEPMTALWLQTTLARLRLAEQRVLPSWWLSTALLELAHGGPAGVFQAIGFQCVLLSNALFLPRVVALVGGLTLRRSYGQLSHGTNLSLPIRAGFIDRALNQLLRPMSPTTRLVLIKDLRLFRRDPLQWSQFLLFFGLLSFYFVYVRRFDYGVQLTGWMTAIGFMNLGVVGLILSTFTTRFVFPLISVEGQRFWILGTAPVNRRDILWSKFIFASSITCLPCCLLVLLSDIALQLWARTPAMVVTHQLICVLLSLGLSAMAVGLGARLPNLREPSPAKIAAGFGGTLTLILSAVFVIAVIVPPAVPAYLMYSTSHLAVLPGSISRTPEYWFVGALAASIGITGLAAWLPMRMGFRAFTEMELL